jgi:hypothetical protein
MMFTARRWLSLAVVAAIAAAPARAADLNKYLPDDTEIVVGIHVTTLAESDLVQKHVPCLVKKYGPELVKRFGEGAGKKLDETLLKELSKFLGDAERVKDWINDNKNAVNRVLIGTTADFEDGNAFLVFEGDFNKDRMKLALDFISKFKALDVAVKPVKEGKYEFYSVKVSGDEDELFVALADDRNVLCCPDRAVMAKALDRGTREKPGVRKELIDVASKIDAKAALWMAAAPKEDDAYVNAHGHVVVTDGIKFFSSVTSKDADAAKDLVSDMKDGLKELGEELKEAVKQYPPLGALKELIEKAEPKADKNVVTLEAEVPAAAVDKLIKDLPALK